VSRFGAAYHGWDEYQRRHAWLGFPLAVRQKYSDDQGGYLAATVTYYAFFSVFPLLLVLVTLLGFLLQGDPSLQRRVESSVLAQLPLLHPGQLHALSGNGLALGVGIVLALWAGMGVFLAVENAMNHLWGVPFRRRPDALRARGKALAMLVALGGGALAATGLGGAGTFGARFGIAWKLGSIALSILLDFALFWVAFRVLTAREVGWRDVRGGAIGAAVLYEALQLIGGWYVGHELRHAHTVYGTFAFVIGLLSYLYLAAHITLLAAEANVVAKRHLWPRSFSVVVEEPATSADERALTQRARVEERRSDQRVDVEFVEKQDGRG
jgi:YihY family inner membrane protein